MNTCIPGFMPLPSAKPPIRANPLGGLNAVIHRTKSFRAESTFNVILETIEGNPILDDPQGRRVFFQPTTCGGEYRFITNPDQDALPLGTSVLTVMIDNSEEQKFYVDVPSIAFQKLKFERRVPKNVTLSGQLLIAPGTSVVHVEFCPVFATPPTVALVQVIPARLDPAPQMIDCHLTELLSTRMTVQLSQAPNTGGYHLAWATWF